MDNVQHYREHAAAARRLARGRRKDIDKILLQLARDFDEAAEDLEIRAVKVRHPELMPQNRG